MNIGGPERNGKAIFLRNKDVSNTISYVINNNANTSNNSNGNYIFGLEMKQVKYRSRKREGVTFEKKLPIH